MSSLAEKSERLKAMGVQPWYARLVLKGAGRSPSFDFDVAQLPILEESAPDAPLAAVSKSKAELLPSLAPISKPSAELSAESARVSEVSIESPSSGAPSCAVGSKTTIQVDLPSEQSIMIFNSDLITVVCGKCSPEQVSSLIGLTSAISSAFYRRNIQLVEAGSFNWPVFDSRSLKSRNTDLHQKSLTRFLRKKSVARSSFVMLLGVEMSADAFLGLVAADEASCQVVSSSVSPSDCLRDPAQKAFLWKELLDARRSV